MIILIGKAINYQINNNSKNCNKIKFIFFIYILILFIIIYFYHETLSEILPKNKMKSEKSIILNTYQKIKNSDSVLLMIPHHGNLGDQAITLAEIKFLKEIFPDIKTIYNLENYENYIHNNTLIFLHGGGNIGWIYNFEEENRRKVIKSYPNNTIVILPQTIYFEDSYKAQQKISSEIYSNHSKLIIFVREKISFNIAKKIFNKNKIILSPDLVTYLDDLLPSNNNQRKGALFLLRKDGEKSLEFKTRNQFISSIQKEYNKYDISDTNFLQLSINSITESKEEVSMILKNISKYEIVITDRLHGMIFSVITKTSCIVIKSYNHKISSSYNWFKHLDYIKLLNSYNIKEFQNLIYYFKKKITKNIYNKNIFNDYYDIIRETLINIK